MIGLALLCVPVVLVVSLGSLLLDSWPGGLWCGLAGLVLGGGLGAVHGYWTTLFASASVDIDV
jgi:hypothetical protein